MDFWKVLKKRRCIRKFKDKEVSDTEIKKILEAGTLAPSEGNLQPWYFVIVKDKDLKSELERAAFLPKNELAQVPLVIVVCIDTEIAVSKYRERGLELYSKQSTAAATENMFLAATNLGLGACWIGAFSEEEVKETLDLEEKFRPVVLFPVGYPAEEGTFWGRKSINEVSEWK